ncbi:MAG TPA: hypothetical protein VH540_02375 [Ktedonobacterales bacterium]|jgi:hypothetical protein
MPETYTTFLEQARAAAQTLEEPELLELIAATEKHHQRSTLSLLIAGLPGSGRSSLANILLGQPRLLPTSPIPKAPIPFEVQGAETSRIEVIGADATRTSLSPENLRPFLTGPTTQASKYERVEIKAQSELLKSATLRVESIGGRSPARWKELLAGTDYVFLVLKAVALLSEEERAFISDVLEPFGLERVAIVINQIDLIDQEERASLVERVRTFLGPFESQPTVIEFSALRNHEEEQQEHPYEQMMQRAGNDLIAQQHRLRAETQRQSAQMCLEALEDTATRQRALAATSEDELKGVLKRIESQQNWLPSRVERAQQRVETFTNTLLRDELLREVEGFSASLREQLPSEIMPVQDITKIRRYLPGYIEALWAEFFRQQQETIRKKLSDEMKQVSQMIEADFRALLGEQQGVLQDGSDGFDPTPARLRTLLLPSRGSHTMGSFATGLQVLGLILLVPYFTFGLAAIGIGQAIRLIFKKQGEQADKQAVLNAANKAVQELEIQVKKQVTNRFETATTEYKKAVADVYTQELERIRGLLENALARRERLASKVGQLDTLMEQTIPALRTLLGKVQAAEGAA